MWLYDSELMASNGSFDGTPATKPLSGYHYYTRWGECGLCLTELVYNAKTKLLISCQEFFNYWLIILRSVHFYDMCEWRYRDRSAYRGYSIGH